MRFKWFHIFLVLCCAPANSVAQHARLVVPIEHILKITVLDYSPNELQLLTASQDNTVKIWDAKLGKRVVELTNGQQKPTSRSETIYNDWRVW